MNVQTLILKSIGLILLSKSVINLTVGWKYFYKFRKELISFYTKV